MSASYLLSGGSLHRKTELLKVRALRAYNQFRSEDKRFPRRGNLFIVVQEYKEKIASSPL